LVITCNGTATPDVGRGDVCLGDVCLGELEATAKGEAARATGEELNLTILGTDDTGDTGDTAATGDGAADAIGESTVAGRDFLCITLADCGLSTGSRLVDARGLRCAVAWKGICSTVLKATVLARARVGGGGLML